MAAFANVELVLSTLKRRWPPRRKAADLTARPCLPIGSPVQANSHAYIFCFGGVHEAELDIAAYAAANLLLVARRGCKKIIRGPSIGVNIPQRIKRIGGQETTQKFDSALKAGASRQKVPSLGSGINVVPRSEPMCGFFWHLVVT